MVKAKYYEIGIDPKTEKPVKVKDKYGKRAKLLYKALINGGADPNVVLPDGLEFYPKSNRIARIASKKP